MLRCWLMSFRFFSSLMPCWIEWNARASCSPRRLNMPFKSFEVLDRIQTPYNVKNDARDAPYKNLTRAANTGSP